MAVLVDTPESLVELMARRKGEGESKWHQRVSEETSNLIHGGTGSLLGDAFAFAYGRDVVWYKVVGLVPLSVMRIPGVVAWEVDPVTLSMLDEKNIRKLVGYSRRMMDGLLTPLAFCHS